MGIASLMGLVREERRMHATEDDERARGSCNLTDTIASKGIARMDADADHLAGADG